MADMSLATLWAQAHAMARSLGAPDAVPEPGPPLSGLASQRQMHSPIVTGVVQDSRQVQPGVLFACVRGASFDGHEFASPAVAAGAVALLVETELPLDVPQVVVADVRAALAWFSAVIAGNPTAELRVFGVTGTNGKTTITHLVESIAEHAGMSTRVIGTLSGARTTPEATDLQPQLANFVAADVGLVAMEVSSHALDQHRADAIEFDVSLFTNLSPDHLNYHHTMEAYFDAKKVLFDGRTRHTIVNMDDEWGARLADELVRPDGSVTGYSMADVTMVSMAADHSVFQWRGQEIRFPLSGAFNVSNAIGAAEAALALGFDEVDVVAGLEQVPQIPGRMEIAVAPSAKAPCILVDYSHTPDGIEKVVETCRLLLADTGSLIIVFGAGGDRDRAKRPLMGAASVQADVVIVTSDNPRSEDPLTIIADVVAGIPEETSAVVVQEPDRRAAIVAAVTQARPGDIVVIAGKGHEATQTISGVAHPFLDLAVAREVFAESMGESGA